MYLFQSWKASLSFFKPGNFKAFFLEAFKIVKQAYYTFFKYFWWLLLLYLILDDYYFAKIFGVFPISLFGVLNFPHFFVHMLIYFTIAIVVIATAKKGSIWGYFLRFLLWLFVIMLFDSLLYWVAYFAYGILPLNVDPNIYWDYTAQFIDSLFLYSPIICLLALFIIDSAFRFKDMIASIGKTFKMAFFNYPFCLLMLIFLNVSFYVFNLLLFNLLAFVGVWKVISLDIIDRVLEILLFTPLFIAFFANFYKKRLKK